MPLACFLALTVLFGNPQHELPEFCSGSKATLGSQREQVSLPSGSRHCGVLGSGQQLAKNGSASLFDHLVGAGE